MRPVRIYLLAGILTVPGYFRPLERALRARYQETGQAVSIEEFFPYGKYGAGLIKQLSEVQHDLRLSPDRAAASIGGKRLVQAVLKEESASKLVFIGHSAGGVAASHAAGELWLHHQIKVERLILIGSPKVRMLPEISERALYLVQRKKWRKDWFSYIGRWGELEAGGGESQSKAAKYWRWRYNPYKYAPAERQDVMTIGRHADYFRDYPPYRGKNGTNLEMVMNEVWQHLNK